MPSVESALQGLGERGCAQIVRQHRCPGDRLQHSPMRAGRRQQRNDQQDMAESGEHELTFENWRTEVKDAFRQNQIRVANEHKAW